MRTTSTAFSGIAAPEIGYDIIAKSAAAILRERVDEEAGSQEPIEILPKHACEWYSKSQNVLLAMP